jgi:hypothetical protein
METNTYSVDEKITVLKNRVGKLDKLLNNDSLALRFGIMTNADTIRQLIDSIESLASEIKLDINTLYSAPVED